MKTEFIGFRVQKEIKDALEEYCKEVDLPLSIVIREAIKEKIHFQK